MVLAKSVAAWSWIRPAVGSGRADQALELADQVDATEASAGWPWPPGRTRPPWPSSRRTHRTSRSRGAGRPARHVLGEGEPDRLQRRVWPPISVQREADVGGEAEVVEVELVVVDQAVVELLGEPARGGVVGGGLGGAGGRDTTARPEGETRPGAVSTAIRRAKSVVMVFLPAAPAGGPGGSTRCFPRQRCDQDARRKVLRLAAPRCCDGLRLRVSAGIGPASPAAGVLDVCRRARSVPPAD